MFLIFYLAANVKYGKQIVATLSQQLTGKYGQSFEYTKITCMIKFAELFPDVEILATLSQELRGSHFIEILPLKRETIYSKNGFWFPMCKLTLRSG
jgi:hypothetical protein